VATLLPNADVPRSRLGGYRVFIFSHDHPHPPHVHIGKGKRFSSWGLMSGTCIDRGGFSSSDIRKQRRILRTFRDAIWSSWNEHWQKQQPKRRKAK
jgi:hypothetical protein